MRVLSFPLRIDIAVLAEVLFLIFDFFCCFEELFFSSVFLSFLSLKIFPSFCSL